MDQKVTVNDIKNYFGYRQISGDEIANQREITVADINRPGLELVGYYPHRILGRVIIMGDKEIGFIETMDEEAQKKAFDFLTSDAGPMILISRDHECPKLLLEKARERNFPIFTSYAPTTSLAIELVSYLEEKIAKSQSIHGVLMSIFGIGTLIRGESGVGKSEIALELLSRKRGHILIADDRVDIARIHNRIIGECPEVLRDLIEIRGVGITNIVDFYGITATSQKIRIDLVIDLVDWHEKEEYVRSGEEPDEFEDFFGVKINKIRLPLRQGHSMAVIIESAVMNYMMHLRGKNTAKEFNERIMEMMKKSKDEQ